MQVTLKRIASSPLAAALTAAGFRLIALYSLFRWRPWLVVNAMMSGGEVTQIAKSIVLGKGFANPLGIVDTGPTAWVCPIYPYIVAGFFRIGGIHTAKSQLMLLTLNCILAGATVFPIYAIAKHSFGTRSAIWAAWLWVVLPSAWQIPIRLAWDSTLNAFSFAVLFWATLVVRRQRALLGWVGYGVLWAVCVLINASIMSLAPFFFGWILWELHKQSRPWFRPLAMSMVIFVLGVVPWGIRNYLVLGKLIPLRSNFGLVLWMANHSESLGFDGFSSPYGNAQQAKLYREVGEIEYMRTKKHEAYVFMRAHPGRTLTNVLRNAWIFWIGVTDLDVNPWYGTSRIADVDFVSNAMLIFLALLAVVLAFRCPGTIVAPYLMVLVFFPPLYYLTRPGLRFRFAIEPILTVLAAHGAVSVLDRAKRRATVRK